MNPFVVPRNASPTARVAKTDYAVNEGDFITDTDDGPRTFQEGDRRVSVERYVESQWNLLPT